MPNKKEPKERQVTSRTAQWRSVRLPPGSGWCEARLGRLLAANVAALEQLLRRRRCENSNRDGHRTTNNSRITTNNDNVATQHHNNQPRNLK